MGFFKKKPISKNNEKVISKQHSYSRLDAMELPEQYKELETHYQNIQCKCSLCVAEKGI